MTLVDAPLVITAEVVTRLQRLRDFAAKRPVSITALMEAMKRPDGKAKHLKNMTAQSIRIAGPWPFFVTFSIETGHPAGTCRHMSMSILRDGRVPSIPAVWMIAVHLGFVGAIEQCTIWLEDLSDGGKAVNVVQPINAVEPLDEVAGHA